MPGRSMCAIMSVMQRVWKRSFRFTNKRKRMRRCFCLRRDAEPQRIRECYANFAPDVHAEEFEDFSVDQYLSLLKLSDAALAQLITYFSQASEDTVSCFSGIISQVIR